MEATHCEDLKWHILVTVCVYYAILDPTAIFLQLATWVVTWVPDSHWSPLQHPCHESQRQLASSYRIAVTAHLIGFWCPLCVLNTFDRFTNWDEIKYVLHQAAARNSRFAVRDYITKSLASGGTSATYPIAYPSQFPQKGCTVGVPEFANIKICVTDSQVKVLLQKGLLLKVCWIVFFEHVWGGSYLQAF